MNRGQFVRQAIAIVSVVCLVACAESRPTKLDPALEGYSKENLTLSLTDLEIEYFQAGTPTPETEQVNWLDDTRVEIKIHVTMGACAQWVDAGYQLVDRNLIVMTIVGDWVNRDGVMAEKCGFSIFEVKVIISELPAKDYQVQLRTGRAVEPRIHPRW